MTRFFANWDLQDIIRKENCVLRHSFGEFDPTQHQQE